MEREGERGGWGGGRRVRRFEGRFPLIVRKRLWPFRVSHPNYRYSGEPWLRVCEVGLESRIDIPRGGWRRDEGGAGEFPR